MRRYFNPYKQFTGVFIPDWLLEWNGCSINAKVLYAILAKFAGKDGECFPSQKQLAEKLGLSERRARVYIKELTKCKLIEVRQPGFGKNNEYSFIWREELIAPSIEIFDHLKSDNDHNSGSSPGRSDPSGQERTKSSSQKRKDASTQHRMKTSSANKESHINESYTTIAKDTDFEKIVAAWNNLFRVKIVVDPNSDLYNQKLITHVHSSIRKFGSDKLIAAIHNRANADYYKLKKPHLRDQPKCFFNYPETISTDFLRNRDQIDRNDQNLPKRGTANHPDSAPSNTSKIQFELSKSDPEQISHFLSKPHPLNKKLLKFYES